MHRQQEDCGHVHNIASVPSVHNVDLPLAQLVGDPLLELRAGERRHPGEGAGGVPGVPAGVMCVLLVVNMIKY